jgi:hypothetical protein
VPLIVLLDDSSVIDEDSMRWFILEMQEERDFVVHGVEQIGRRAMIGLEAASDSKDTHGRLLLKFPNR